MEKYFLYINGKFTEASDKGTFISYDPSNGEAIAEISSATLDDTTEAIKSARRAFDSNVWYGKSREERSRIIKQIVDKINENKERLTELEIKDSGSTFKKATEDIYLSARNLNSFAKMALTDFDEVSEISKAGVSKNLLKWEPVGVCSLIIPWNFPLKMAIWKIGPALAAGCTLVLKPAPETSVTALELARLIDQTDLPKGVVNVITGDADVGTEMITNPLVDKVSFTGSTEVGKVVMKNASESLKKITLECGGKSANIVLDDADLEMAVDGAIYAGFYHQGQCCEGGTRLLIQETIYNDFIARLKTKIEKMKIGNPMDKGTDIGPVVSEEQFNKVLNYIKIAKDEGAELLTGGERYGTTGFFIKPTAFINVRNEMRNAQEEIFGPVISIIKFKDDNEAIIIANDSIYGLGGAVWSANESRALQLAAKLKAGTVWINEYHLLNERVPFGGYKQSGIGREFGLDGIKEYMELKHIHIDEVKVREKKFWYGTVVPKD
ncbi:aldehyde dehydrogenase family protein [Ignavibacteria bacterium CHB1]|nr:MAG: aldehyde dehydrogenase family protein [Chlorobiota bacterium]MBV6398960.1 putative aldehyde dehydrogenase AldA [Ignavibacteria bacterium]MCC6886202.1 aldehyde dehydrogenase family protein [Ignavibacteriales bacterium]MCE7953868.1 aldehyde dehydrogenase family protein [Chlorobi bacterium CHB7]MDL1887817.1 aldehyde dehydrogenase family protein [Ignavibacteria bacterium CHB1]RIK47886.1 MAG: aldehyde dehydrogenase [Ignavibacteriota bacterium]